MRSSIQKSIETEVNNPNVRREVQEKETEYLKHPVRVTSEPCVGALQM